MIPKIEVIAIGDELLNGRQTDTNSTWIGSQLSALGLAISHHQTVQDDIKHISNAFALACSRADIIISTGGLGPTQDDLTFEGLSNAVDCPLTFDQNVFDGIKQKYAQKNLPIPDSNKRQAWLPQDAVILENKQGTAPGVQLSNDNAIIIALPGVPGEMKGMFTQHILPQLGQDPDHTSLSISFFGLAEAVIEEKILHDLKGLKLSSQVTYAVTAAFPLVHFQFRFQNALAKHIKMQLRTLFFSHYSQYLWHFNKKSIDEHIVLTLKERGWQLHVAESMTGGMLSSALVSVPGCSGVFGQGLITYQDTWKVNLLGVTSSTLRASGAISKDTTLEMARGLLKRYEADVGIAITGVAGPLPMPDTCQQGVNLPVGRTYICWVGPGFEDVRTWTFNRNRHQNRVLATHHALIGLYERIKNN